MTIKSNTTKIIALLTSLIIFALSAGLTLAGNTDTVEDICVEVSILATGEYMYGNGYNLNTKIADTWVTRKNWYSPGQSYELYDLNTGNQALFIWFNDGSAPYSEAFGAAHVTIYTGQEAGAACNEPADTSINDGRINSKFNHMLASVFPASDGYDVYLYNPESGVGEIDFTVSWSDIEAGLAAADEALEWQLVASGSGGSFFAGSGGECFIVSPNASGEMQTFSWNCASS